MRDITQDIFLNNVFERFGIEHFIIYVHAFLNIKVLFTKVVELWNTKTAKICKYIQSDDTEKYYFKVEIHDQSGMSESDSYIKYHRETDQIYTIRYFYNISKYVV